MNVPSSAIARAIGSVPVVAGPGPSRCGPDPSAETQSARPDSPDPLLVVAWLVLLAASLLPRVLIQEVLRHDFSDDARLVVAGSRHWPRSASAPEP